MIVCLGWGSLIWNLRNLPVNSSGCLDNHRRNSAKKWFSNGPWLLNGPSLPVEFARQSKDGRITLVITPDVKPIQVFSAVMDVTSMEAALCALAERETGTRIPLEKTTKIVGFWSRKPSDSSNPETHPEVECIAKWAETLNYDGVVWTALKPKFRRKDETPTIDQVLEYLCRDLSGDKLERAKEYVRRTPASIQTEYRYEIERALGWTPIDV